MRIDEGSVPLSRLPWVTGPGHPQRCLLSSNLSGGHRLPVSVDMLSMPAAELCSSRAMPCRGSCRRLSARLSVVAGSAVSAAAGALALASHPNRHATSSQEPRDLDRSWSARCY